MSVTSVWRRWVCSAAWAGIAAMAVCGSAVGQALQTKLEQLFAAGDLQRCHIAGVMMDAEKGVVLAAVNEDSGMIPASNMKLITSGAGLSVLGTDFEFRTELRWDASARRLVVLGSGDPAFGDPKLLEQMRLTPEAFVDLWAVAVSENGIERVDELVVDDRIFDRDFVHPSWPRDQLNRWYCAEVAGLNFHTNCLEIYTRPVVQGRPAHLEVQPESPWIELTNRTKTVETGRHTAWASRGFMTNEITVHGDVRYSSDPVEVTFHDPPSFFGALLHDRLDRAGIEVSTVRVAKPDEDLEGGEVLHTVRSSMETVLSRVNVNSQNMYAEALFKRLGAEVTRSGSSWNESAAAVRMVLADRLGPQAGEEVVVADGSGMSRDNRVTASILAQWLRSMHRDRALFNALFESMAHPGIGTLRRRFAETRGENEIRAKSGYLRGVSALSGYVSTPDRSRTIIFVTLTNDIPADMARTAIRRMEERVAELADEYLTEQVKASGRLGG